MDLGIHYSQFTHPEWETKLVDRLTDTAKIADQGGVNLLTVMDHWFQMETLNGPFEPMLEGYSTLGYLAGITENVRLSKLVTGITYRYPALLAKIATTVDVLSRGRLLFGIGAAWYDREHEGLGVPFPPLKERFEMLEEGIQVAQQMWSDNDGPFDSLHFHLKETICLPRPVRGKIPVLIGGGGERKTLLLVAKYGDACHLFAREGVEGVAHKIDVLKQHCEDVGRDYSEIEITIGGGGGIDPITQTDEWLSSMEEYAKLGVTLVTTTPQGDDPAAWTTKMVENVLPRLKQI